METARTTASFEKRLRDGARTGPRASRQISQFGLMEMSRQRFAERVIAGSPSTCRIRRQGIVRSNRIRGLRCCARCEEGAQKQSSIWLVQSAVRLTIYNVTRSAANSRASKTFTSRHLFRSANGHVGGTSRSTDPLRVPTARPKPAVFWRTASKQERRTTPT